MFGGLSVFASLGIGDAFRYVNRESVLEKLYD